MIMPGESQIDIQKKILELVRLLAQRDEELRSKYQIGDKFRFVRDRVKDLLDRLEHHLKTKQFEEEKIIISAGPDEELLYVYLFNAHGMNIKSWKNMLLPKVFLEYSVNRPIYTEKKFIEMLLRSKNNIFQHAYFTIAVKRKDIIHSSVESSKDILGNPVVKVKEGSLRFDKLISFTHNKLEYEVTLEGELVKKNH